MKGIIGIIFSLFESKYTEYTLFKSETIQVEITEEVEDTKWSGGYGITDPLDVKTIGTGKFVEHVQQTWVAYHKKTKLPKYKKIVI